LAFQFHWAPQCASPFASLQVFVAIGRIGNVTYAADELAMSQSAASTALGEIEKQFGRPLFDRIGKRLI